jgi:hypothetical protein
LLRLSPRINVKRAKSGRLHWQVSLKLRAVDADVSCRICWQMIELMVSSLYRTFFVKKLIVRLHLKQPA